MRFVVELPHERADGLERGTVARDVDLPAEPLAQQRTRNGHQVRSTFRGRDVYRAPSDNRGIRKEIRHSRKHQPVGRFGHLDRVRQRADVFAVDGEPAVGLDGPDRNENNVVALQILINLCVRQAGEQTRAHLRARLRPG